MIRFILLQNRQGRTRLAKYYVPLEDAEKRKLEVDIHRLVVNRDPKVTNFLEVRPRPRRGACSAASGSADVLKRSTVPHVQGHLPPLRGPLLLHVRRCGRCVPRALRGAAPALALRSRR